MPRMPEPGRLDIAKKKFPAGTLAWFKPYKRGASWVRAKIVREPHNNYLTHLSRTRIAVEIRRDDERGDNAPSFCIPVNRLRKTQPKEK